MQIPSSANQAHASRLVSIVSALLKKEPAKHHKFGPSTLKNREICPGWKNRSSSDEANVLADEGTLMHLAFEKRDLSILPEEEQRICVQKCIDYVSPLERNAIEIKREVRLHVLRSPEAPEGLTFGTADELILRRLPNGKLHIDVVDEKYGRWEVDDAKTNRQGFSYVLGAFDLPGEWSKAESATVHFLSPRIDVVTKHTFFRSDIPRLSMVVSTIINRAETWDRTRDPSMLRLEELNCTYCARSGTPDCPLSVSYAVAHAKKYKPLEVAEETHSSQITDPEKMRQFYIALRVLEKMVDSGKQHVHAFAQTQDIPGFVRRERKGKVTITNSVLAWPVLKDLLGLTSFEDQKFAELLNCASFSYTDISKLLTAGISGKGSGAAKAKILGELWTRLQNAECVTESEPTAYLQRDKEDAQAELASKPIDVVTTPVAAPATTDGGLPPSPPSAAPVAASTDNRGGIPASRVTGAAVD